MSSHSSTRCGGGTMTWTSSRHSTATNDVPHNASSSSSYRANERSPAIFTPAYSVRNTAVPNTRSGFPLGKCYSNSTYSSRNSSALQRNGANCYASRDGSNTVSNRNVLRCFQPTTIAARNVYHGRADFVPRNITNVVAVGGRPQPHNTNVPKFFPMNQAITYPAQFPDNMMPVPIPYHPQMRRASHAVQPVVPRRSLRFPTPTVIMISKNMPIGVEVPRRSCEASALTQEAIHSSVVDEDVADEANSDENNDDDEEGRGLPDASPMPQRSNEDTWDLWDRVYSDPGLRQSIEERQAMKKMKSPKRQPANCTDNSASTTAIPILRQLSKEDSPMSEILRSDELCRAQAIFLNVPRLAPEPGCEQKTRSPRRRGVVGFSLGNESQLEEAQIVNKERRLVPTESIETLQQPEIESVWTVVEWKDLIEFKKDLVRILDGKHMGMVLSDALSETCVTKRRGVVAAAAEQWPTGLIRLFSPEVKTIGRCVCLAGHEDMAALVRRAAQEGTPRLMSDSWEPIPLCEIRTEQHLITYLAAFLSRFGPQHTVIDIPLKLLLKSLSGNWPTTGPQLAEWLLKGHISSSLYSMSSILVSSIRHRRILVEAVQPLSSLKFKFVNPANR